jgi:hypothetical protein
MSKHTKAERAESLERLREWFPKGSTVYTVLRHVSKSGMSRDIGVLAPFVSKEYGIQFMHPNHATSVVLGVPLKRDAVRIGGAGMDMGYHIAYSLSHALYGDGYALKHAWV